MRNKQLNVISEYPTTLQKQKIIKLSGGRYFTKIRTDNAVISSCYAHECMLVLGKGFGIKDRIHLYA